MTFERSLVLNRFIHGFFGAESLEDLRRALRDQDEGPGPDGQSRFFHVLSGRADIRIDRRVLANYDSRILAYEALLARNRRAERFRTFKYFQYLALLYTEIFLDQLTANPSGFLHELNMFRSREPALTESSVFGPDDLRRLAFFMATGSGKTLLLHVNVLQLLHYLGNGSHPQALVRRPDGRKEFDNILLITPGESLSDQHIAELNDSGLNAGRFDKDATDGLFGPRVQVIEIQKLAEETSGEGVSVSIDALGTRNLVIVDEGHKGTGSEAKAWKSRQKALSEDGFLLEYSATFAQAIGAATKPVRKGLIHEYGRAILFDYSYRYFYGDGYGKTFRVLNLKKASASKAYDLMLGGLLIFYQQAMLYARYGAALRPYNVEKPLWVLLGTSVSRKRPDEKDTSKTAEEERTDVAEVVAFLRKFLEAPDWAVARIERTLSGSSGFSDPVSGADLFARDLRHVAKENPTALYRRICGDLFHGQGGLEVVEIGRSGEIGLRVSAASHKELAYFAIINIGDVTDFKKHLEKSLRIATKKDVFNESLFDQVGHTDSPINMLIGAKKFIEGWSSWRVSSMGLLRVGKGEGSQVIQLFGRGVRLKGKGLSLKRSYVLGDAPEWLESLETLFIVGWNADYLQVFRAMLEREELAKELKPLRVRRHALPDWAVVPQTPESFDCSAETWELNTEGPRVVVDLLPQLSSLAPTSNGAGIGVAPAGEMTAIVLGDPPYSDLLDVDSLHADLVQYKSDKGYGNVFIRRAAMRDVLASRCELRMSTEEAREPSRVQQAAGRALKTYLDRFVRLRERQSESVRAQPMMIRERQILDEYRIRVHAEGAGEELLKGIEKLLAKPVKELLADAAEPLPRLYLEWHLFNPVLVEGGKEWQAHVDVSPAALSQSEKRLLEDLRAFWARVHSTAEYRDVEVRVLRNLPKVGVGMFVRSGFYPDFILWIRSRKTKSTRVVFLDPHGLHHEGVQDNDRFEAIEKLRSLSTSSLFRKKKISLDGYILAPPKTTPDRIPGAGRLTWNELEERYPLLRQDGRYVSKVLAGQRDVRGGRPLGDSESQ